MTSPYQDRTVIVVGEQHYTPLGVIRSLGENGIRPIAVIVNINGTKTASSSRYIRYCKEVDSYHDAFNFICDTFRGQTPKPILIPCDDVSVRLFDANYDELKNDFIFNNAGQNGRIAHFQNKDVLYKLATKHGLNVANVQKISTDASNIPENIDYPIITKPVSSYTGWKQDYHVCNHQADLIDALALISPRADEVLIQKYIEKETERTLEGASVNNGNDVFVSIETRYTYSLPDYYSMKMEVMEPQSGKTISALRNMLKEIGFEGIFEVEFLEDANGTLWFLEINFRNSTWSYASTKLGMPLPLIWADGMVNGAFHDVPIANIPKKYTAIAEIPDFGQRVMRFKMISPFEWIKEIFSADCLYFFNAKDPVPFFSLCLFFVRSFLKKIHCGKSSSKQNL